MTESELLISAESANILTYYVKEKEKFITQEHVVSSIEDCSTQSANIMFKITGEELHETAKMADEVMLKFYTGILDVQAEQDSTNTPVENILQPRLSFQVAKICAHELYDLRHPGSSA